MKINSDKLRALAAMSDTELWAEIGRMAQGFGQRLPREVPPHEDMEKIRAALSGAQINLADAMALLRARGGQK